jgi:hypothetical protein
MGQKSGLCVLWSKRYKGLAHYHKLWPPHAAAAAAAARCNGPAQQAQPQAPGWWWA